MTRTIHKEGRTVSTAYAVAAFDLKSLGGLPSVQVQVLSPVERLTARIHTNGEGKPASGRVSSKPPGPKGCPEALSEKHCDCGATTPPVELSSGYGCPAPDATPAPGTQGANDCGKLRYLDQPTAVAAIARQRRQVRGVPLLHTYRCPRCGWWHITSQPQRPACRAIMDGREA